MKKVLITGANGFVGMALCKRMSSEGWKVHASTRSALNTLNLREAAKTRCLNSIDGTTDWSSVVAGIDTIVHLAARVHVMRESSADPLNAFRRVNVEGTIRLARQAAAAGVRRFVFLSTVKVNGEGSVTPYSELDTPNPQDAYAVSKWETEQILHQIAAKTALELVILRPPLVYGPGVKANFFQLLKIVNKGIPLPLSNINNNRSLIYIGNLIDAIVACVVRPEADGKTYLVSDGMDVSTPELIRRVALALGKKARLLPCPPDFLRLAAKLIGRSVEMERLLGSLTLDILKIQRELGWQAPYTMALGLRETAAWFLKNQSPGHTVFTISF